jgi:hypothetical protein
VTYNLAIAKQQDTSMSTDLVQTLREFKIFFDMEASGLADDSYPIEVGITGDGLEYTALIKPHDDWTYWSSASQNIHGISRKLLANEGKDITTVCNELNKMFKGQVIWSDSKFDPFWLEILFDKAGIQMAFAAKNMTHKMDRSFVAKLGYELPEENRKVHRALPDAEDLRDAWERVCTWVEVHQTKPQLSPE